MQNWFDTTCAARLQVVLWAPVKNVLDSSHDYFLFAFDWVFFFHFLGAVDDLWKIQTPWKSHGQFFFVFFCSFSGSWKHPPSCQCCFSTSKPSVRMSVTSGVSSPKIKTIKQKSMMTSSCLFAMFTAMSRCSRLGQTESNYPVSVGEAKLTFSGHDSKSHYVQSRHFSASWTVVGAKLILAARWRIDMKMTLVIQLGAGQEWLLLDACCIQCNCNTNRRSCSRWISLRESSRRGSFRVNLFTSYPKPWNHLSCAIIQETLWTFMRSCLW